MTLFSDKFKNIARAAAVVTALGATAFTAMPAQAQSSGSFGLSFGGGHGPGFSFQIGDDDNYRPGRRCLSQRQLINEIRDDGYRNVRLREYGRRWAEARATRGGWVYELTVNSCTGRIVDRDRIRRS